MRLKAQPDKMSNSELHGMATMPTEMISRIADLLDRRWPDLKKSENKLFDGFVAAYAAS